jgi:Bifunctional DNA primase/polymerase, N-terminal
MIDRLYGRPNLLGAALAYVNKGFAIFPLRPRSKEPFKDDKFFRTVGGYKAATRDPELIRFWWGRHPDANIGVATGSVSAIWVLDLDNEQDEAWLARLAAAHPDEPLPSTVEVITGSGGRHLHFRYPRGLDLRNAGGRNDMPDVRGNGGYAVLPSSIHPSGRPYAWSVDSASEFADAPRWLIDAVMNRGTGKSGAAEAHSPESWRIFIDQEHDGSHRENAVATLYGHLVRHYVDPVMALSICRMFDECRNKPPLNIGEVDRICNDIAKRELERRRQRARDGGK